MVPPTVTEATDRDRAMSPLSSNEVTVRLPPVMVSAAGPVPTLPPTPVAVMVTLEPDWLMVAVAAVKVPTGVVPDRTSTLRVVMLRVRVPASRASSVSS